MCAEVNVIRSGQVIECTTVADLADALGVPTHVVSDDPGHCCLCNAKLTSLGARQATPEEGWPFPEWVIEG